MAFFFFLAQKNFYIQKYNLKLMTAVTVNSKGFSFELN